MGTTPSHLAVSVPQPLNSSKQTNVAEADSTSHQMPDVCRSGLSLWSWMQSSKLQAVDEDEHEHTGKSNDAVPHSLNDDVSLRQRYGSVPSSPRIDST